MDGLRPYTILNGVLEGCLKRCVVGVFSPRKPQARPIPAQIHSDHLVGYIGLAISLRVEGGCHVQLGARECEELLPERRSEH